VDKNLKHPGLIQAFSRTNRVLNDSKPWGNILDFRGQEKEVNEAIKLFSGKKEEGAEQIWLVDPAPVVVEKYKAAVDKLEAFMQKQGLACEPSEVTNLQGDAQRASFINHFKEVQKFKNQLEQYTELDDEQKAQVAATLPIDTLRGFKGAYLETAKDLKRKLDTNKGAGELPEEVEQLEFEFVLFASALIDYDYIMGLIAKSTQGTSKQSMTRQQLIDLICSQSNLMSERDELIAYIHSLPSGEALNVSQIHAGYQAFKMKKATSELNDMAIKHGLTTESLQAFVDGIMGRMIFDGEKLGDLLEPLELGWKERTKKELALMEDLVPYLHKLAQGREISGLAAYE
jgi:type I restriction enzyme R subunit